MSMYLHFSLRWFYDSRGSLQLGPKATEFLNKPSFILKIRSTKRGIGAARSKKVFQPPVLASTVSTRKARTRLDPDPVESFSPDTNGATFDDIEVEPEPHEPHTGTLPLVRAREVRAAPSIEFVERPIEDASSPQEKCMRELCDLRDKVGVL